MTVMSDSYIGLLLSSCTGCVLTVEKAEGCVDKRSIEKQGQSPHPVPNVLTPVS